MGKYLPLGVIAVALAILAAIGWALASNPQPVAPPTTGAVVTSAPTLNGGDAGPGEEHNPETSQAHWEPVVTRFARAFTNTKGGHKAWVARIVGDPEHPTVAEAVGNALTTVDIDNVPTGKLQAVTLVESGPFQATAKATYRTGWSMIVTVNTDGTDWFVVSYDRLDES